jgi:hypothetical protein
MEGARLRCVVGLFRDVLTPIVVQDGESTIRLKAGQRVMCNLVSFCDLPQ